MRKATSASLVSWAILMAMILLLFSSGASAQIGDVQYVHDPRIIQCGEFYYLYSTGIGIPIRRSKDLITWKEVGPVFTNPPAWILKDYPQAKFFWAPDVAYFANVYHLYFSISRFGRNDSRIGLETNTTLDPNDPNYKWVDQGAVFSTHRGDNWNAIDPAVVLAGENDPWLVMGSFWDGIKLHRLDAHTGLASNEDPKLYSLVRRPMPDAVEAGYMIHRGEYFYMFASFDLCCRGVRSTYKTVVGRSKSVTGPFVDMAGKSMLDGGGSIFQASHDNVMGPGHGGVLHALDQDWFVHHFYDAFNSGMPTLQINSISWNTDAWPVIGKAIATPPATTQPAAK